MLLPGNGRFCLMIMEGNASVRSGHCDYSSVEVDFTVGDRSFPYAHRTLRSAALWVPAAISQP